MMLAFLFVLPAYGKLRSLQYVSLQKQSEYDSKSAYYEKISLILKEIESKKDALEKMNSALPTNSYLSSLVYFFQKEGGQSGLTIKSLVLSKISTPAKKNDVRDVTFTMHVLGNYESFKSFLSSLDTSARIFEVNSISFTSPGSLQSRNKNQIYDITIEVVTHTY